MARIINPERRDDPPHGIGCQRWVVRGLVCDNAAAKFWSGLIDEVLASRMPRPSVFSSHGCWNGWMAVPSEQWNDASVWGAFAAKDPSRRRRYDVHCQLSNRHLSEGLFERETRLQATLQPSESSP